MMFKFFSLLLLFSALNANSKEIPKELKDESITLLNFKLGESKLSDVLKVFKSGSIVQSGDASNSESIICFRGQDDILIQFISGEMGGPNKVISEMRLIDNKIKRIKSDMCPFQKEVDTHLKLNGISLHSLKKALINKLGMPSKEKVDRLEYHYLSQKIVNKEHFKNELFDITSFFIVEFVRNKAVYISLTKIESL